MVDSKLVLLAALLAPSNGIYEREAGHYDWLSESVGEISGWISSVSEKNQVTLASVDGIVGGLDTTDGSLNWRTRISNSGMRSMIETVSGIAVVVSKDGVVSGLDTRSGSLLWVYNSDGSSTSVSVCHSADVVQIHPSGNRLNATDGTPTQASPSCNSPVNLSPSPIVAPNGVQVSVGPGLVISGEHERHRIWTREESLAYIDKLYVVDYRKDAPVGTNDLSWLIGGYKAAVCYSKRTNRLVVVDIVDSKILGAMELPKDVFDIDYESGEIILVGDQPKTLDLDSMQVKPASRSADETAQYQYKVNEATGEIKGMKNEMLLWNFNLRAPVLAIVEQQNTEFGNVPVLVKGDASVVFKYMNPNLVVVVSRLPGNPRGVVITAFDSVTGAIPSQTVVEKASPDREVHTVVCDNWIVAHYYNEESDRFEVISIDFYDKREDKGFYAAATGQASQQQAVTAYDLPTDIHVVTQQYIFPLGPVTALGVTATQNGVTPRQVIFATLRGLLAVRKDTWLNPRRPVDGVATHILPDRLKATSEDGLPPYQPVLPVISTDFLNHANSLKNPITQIISFPTHLESTSIVVAVGSGDMFVAPVYIGNAPYDVLSPFFNYWLLYVSFSAVAGAVLVTTILARRKQLYDKWK
jgi:hypothetical protein